MATQTIPARPSSQELAAKLTSSIDGYFSRLNSDPPAAWNLTAIGGLLALVLLWAGWTYTMWGHWGNLTVDSGHEMYVPAVLAEGKTLYRDVWFAYGPAAPYFNSYLFRIFGMHLNVLCFLFRELELDLRGGNRCCHRAAPQIGIRRGLLRHTPVADRSAQFSAA